MAYNESICRAGRTEEHRLYYSIRHNNGCTGGERRAAKTKPTTEKQAAINRKRAEQNLTRIMNASFGKDDIYVTYSYEPENRPGSYGEFKRQIRETLKKMRRLYKKQGILFRYVWVAERGDRGATHVHMVQSGIDGRVLQQVWPYGWVTVKPMDPSGSYHKLAAYFIKYSDKTMRTEEQLQGKRYNASRNLIHPIPEKTRIRKRRSFDPNNIKVPDGWYVDKDTVEHGMTGMDEEGNGGFEFLSYTLVMLPGYTAPKRAGRRR